MKVVKSLNAPIAQVERLEEKEDEEDEETMEILLSEGQSKDDVLKKRRDEKNFQKLFENCKFFLSREVPRECLVFIIR